MQNNNKGNPKNNKTWQESFHHQPAGRHPAPRMSQKSRGNRGMRKGAR